MLAMANLFRRNNPLDGNIHHQGSDGDGVYDDDYDDDDVVHRTFREVSSSRLWSTSHTATSDSTDVDAYPIIDSVEINASSALDDDDDFDDDDDDDDGGDSHCAINTSTSSTLIIQRRNNHRRRKFVALLTSLLLSSIAIYSARASKNAKRNLRYEQFISRIVQLSSVSMNDTNVGDDMEEKFADTNSPQHRALIYLVDGDSSYLVRCHTLPWQANKDCFIIFP